MLRIAEFALGRGPAVLMGQAVQVVCGAKGGRGYSREKAGPLSDLPAPLRDSGLSGLVIGRARTGVVGSALE